MIAVAWSSDYGVEGRAEEELEQCRRRDTVVVQVDYPNCIGINDKVSAKWQCHEIFYNFFLS